MPKEEWGTKRVCPTTGKRFYDLNRSPIVSPYTGEVVTLETGSRGGRTIAAEKPVKKPKASQTEDAEEVETGAAAEGDDLSAEVLDQGDDVLDDSDDDDDKVSLDDLADVAAEDEES